MKKGASLKTKMLKFLSDVSFWWGSVFTSAMTIGSLVDRDFPYDGRIAPLILGTAIGGVLPLLLGYFGRKKLKRLIQLENIVDLERITLIVAQSNNGTLSPTLLSMKADISIEEAKQTLESLVEKGVATVDINNDGTVVYIFKDLMLN